MIPGRGQAAWSAVDVRAAGCLAVWKRAGRALADPEVLDRTNVTGVPDMTASETSLPITRMQQVGLIMVMLACFTEALTVAFNIGAIMTRFDASGAEAGFVATAQGLCVALAALTGTRLIARQTARSLVAIGLVLVAAGHALAILATSVVMMAAFQAIGGLGTGLVVCVVMATAARTPKPEMTYGLINGSVGAYLSVLALTVPKVLAFGGFTAAYGFYAILALAGLLWLPAVPNTRAPKTSGAPVDAAAGASEQRAVGKPAGWIALVGMGVLFCSIAGMGAFIERIGVKAEISLQTIGWAFFGGGLLTIVGPISAGIVGARFGSTRPLVLLGALICVAAFGLAVDGAMLSYLISVPLWIVLPAVLMPFFLGGLAVVDPSGKLAGAHPAFATLGGSMGPLTAGALADAAGYRTLGWIVVAAVIAALTLMAFATRRADKIRVTEAKLIVGALGNVGKGIAMS